MFFKMGCVCCSLSSFVSIVLNALERISLCTVCALLVCCILFTILTVMILGIGIGFHYCTVQASVEGMKKAAAAAGALRSGPESARKSGPGLRSVEKAVKRGFAHHIARRDIDNLMPNKNRSPNDTLLLGKHSTDVYNSLNNTYSSNNSFVNISRTNEI